MIFLLFPLSREIVCYNGRVMWLLEAFAFLAGFGAVVAVFVFLLGRFKCTR